MERRGADPQDRVLGAIASAGALALLAGGAGAALTARGLELLPRLATLQVDQLVELVVVAVGVLVAGWFAVSSAIATACLVGRAAGRGWRTGEHLVARWAPVLVRRTLSLAVAAGVGLGTAVGAGAVEVSPSPVPVASQTAATDDLGWPVSEPTPTPGSPTPDAATAVPLPSTTPADTRPVDPPSLSSAAPDTTTPAASDHATPAPGPTATPPSRQAADRAPAGADRVVVQPGDTLWQIARRHLPPAASDAQVAAAWPAWYQANRSTIGDDPDLILPGQVLTVPGDRA